MEPPQIAEAVRIAAPGLDRISAEVAEGGFGWLGLRVVDSCAPVARLFGSDAAIEYIRDEGMYRLLGRIEPADGVWAGSPLRFVATTAPHLLDRREHIRAEAELLVVLAEFEGAKRTLGRTRDISGGGMLVAAMGPPLPPGYRLRFSLVVPGSARMVNGRCRAIRVTPDGDVAFAFEGLKPESVDALTRFAYEHTAVMRAASRRRSAGTRH